MKPWLPIGAIAIVAGALTLHLRAQNATNPPRVSVIVELFTSEGCSDCPPADSVLTRLASQPPQGADVIALGEHVDYWDRQGWRDPFSSAGFTARQTDYVRALNLQSAYTPQMVVNGRDEFVGSDYSRAVDAIAKAARDAAHRLTVSLTLDPARNGIVPAHVKIDSASGTRGSADVFVAVTEDGLQSHVTAGENRGRDLKHSAVVRSLTRIATVAPKSRTWSGGGEITLDGRWKTGAVRIVAFAQDHDRREILGATSASIR
jgi:hypothetical protein